MTKDNSYYVFTNVYYQNLYIFGMSNYKYISNDNL